MLIIISISLSLYFLLRRKSDKVKNIPLACIAITILVLEVIKQYFTIKEGNYGAWSIPLHFCSLFLFFFPLATLIPNKKVKTFGSTMSLVCCVWMTVLFYIAPRTIIGDSCRNVFGNFFSFHTFIYHHLAILYLFIGLLLNQFKISKHFYIHTFVGMTCYGLVAIPLAYILDTNYCNILFSNIGLMENLRVRFGQIIYTIVLYLVGLGGATLTCLVYRKIKGGENNE